MTVRPVIEVLSDDGDFVLARGQLDDMPATQLFVRARSRDPAPSGVARLQHALALRGELDPAWAVVPRALVHDDGRPVLLLDDPGGTPLSRLLERPLELGEALRVAVGLAAAIGQMHERGLVHKDVKPANVLVHETGTAVWLTGFGIASRLPREKPSPGPAEIIAGTLAYMAPEQTGRMNRSIDSRSDLYSAGMTLYELLAGTLPFSAPDPMGWIHCHVARAPAPLPEGGARRVPAPLAAIVMKLLAKNAEERYQTAAGLESDLRRCLREWEASGRIEPFEIGANDVSPRLQIPERLYGRQAQIEVLLGAFERVVTERAAQLVLVSGYSGVGKSAVVKELHKALVPPRGLFATGKFDQFKRDIPYATIAQALRSLVLQLLGQSDAQLGAWRDRLRDAVGLHGQLMIGLIPELELVIGPQPAAQDLGPQHAKVVFQGTFRRLLGVFAAREHPLVVFLDDLQWLDPATLELLEHLMSGDEVVEDVLLIGAYRDNEVGPDHRLKQTLATLLESGARVSDIRLEPLTLEDIGHLIADALPGAEERTRPLAELVHRRTSGNPFFVVQFLTLLNDEGLVAFEPAASTWRWNLDDIAGRELTDDVADLMAAKLERLSEPTRQALKQLACLGSAADVPTLLLVRGGADAALDQALREAVLAGLILRGEGAYTFLHDRVQEAAYALLHQSERAPTHLRIGRLLAARSGAAELEDSIFEIVSQYNRATELITESGERVAVARLNLVAGKRAKTALAYGAARAYLETAAALIAPLDQAEHRALTFAIELQRAECEVLTGDLPGADARLEALSRRKESLVDLAAVCGLRVDLFAVLDRFDRSVDVALEYLEGLGISWSKHPTEAEVLAEYQRLWQQLGDRPIEVFADLPPMIDPIARATMDVLTRLHPASLFFDKHLPEIVIGRMANLSLERGNTDGSPFGYAWLGSILSARHFAMHDAARRFARVSVAVVEKPGLDRFKSRVYSVFGGLVTPWLAHLRTSFEPLQRSFDAARRTGDLTFIAYAPCFTVSFALGLGRPLDEVRRDADAGVDIARKCRFGLGVELIASARLVIRALRGAPEGELDESEEATEQRLTADPHLAIAACWYWIRKLQARFAQGDTDGAMQAVVAAEGLLWTSSSMFQATELQLYAALTRASCHATRSDAERRALVAAIRIHQEVLAAWAKNCPENYASPASLVAAELARVEGRLLEAEGLYEQAIAHARTWDFVNHEALASELAARFHRARGIPTIAGAYLRNARICYLRWGALAKVRELDLLSGQVPDEGTARPAPPTIATAPGLLELDTVLKASRAISGEIVQGRLSDALLRLALTHAGAQRGLLVLPRGETMWIEAEATSSAAGINVEYPERPATTVALPETVLRHVVRTRESVILDDASSSEHFSADPYLASSRAQAILCLPLLKQTRLAGVLYLENRVASHAFVPSGVALLQLLASQAAIALENARMHADLVEQENRVRLAVDTIAQLTWSCTPDGFVDMLNQRWLAYTGLQEAEALGWGWTAAVHPDDVPTTHAQWSAAIQAGSAVEYESRMRRFDGEYRWFLSRTEPLRDGAGRIVKWYGTSTDIHERRRAEDRLQASLEDKEALLREVHHRVKNNLQLISSLLSLQGSRSPDPEVAEMLKESRNRVRSMALVHENLYRAGSFARISMAPHIQNLCAQLTRAYGLQSQRVELEVQVTELSLDMDRAVTCGLIINELVSNALKHAFADGRSGTIRVQLEPLDDARYVLVVGDDGVGLRPDLALGQLETLGLQLVHDLTGQLGGAIEILRAQGTKVRISFAAQGPAERRS